MEKLSENGSDLKVNTSDIVSQQQMLSTNIETLVNNPPMLMLDKDARLTNITVYAEKWENLGRSLEKMASDMDSVK